MLDMGINGGFALGGWPGTRGTAAQASPQGPTAASAGFGTATVMGGGEGDFGKDPVLNGVLSVGMFALAALVFIWWSLPR